jgi:hypothetical protein
MKTFRVVTALLATTAVALGVNAAGVMKAGALAVDVCPSGDATFVNTLPVAVDGYVDGGLAFHGLASGAFVASYPFVGSPTAGCTATDRLQLFPTSAHPTPGAPVSGALVNGLFTVTTGHHDDIVAGARPGGTYGLAKYESVIGAPATGNGVFIVRHEANAGPVDVYMNGHKIGTNIANGRTVTTPVPHGTLQLRITATGTNTDVVAPRSVSVSGGTSATTYLVSARNGSQPNTLTTHTVLGGGYRIVTSDGGVFTFGSSRFFGSAAALPLASPVVSGVSTPSGNGYWLVASDGGVFTFGDAHFFGSAASIPLRAPVVAMASTPTGQGYWLVTSDGGVFTFGDARFHGSLGAVHLAAPIVAFAPTRTGTGYLMLGKDGGVFAFGDAHFRGPAAQAGTTPISLGAPDSGSDYWVMFANGGRTELDATRPFLFPQPNPIPTLHALLVSSRMTSTGHGLWAVASDGGVFTLGNAGYYGNLVGTPHNAPIVAIL